MTNERYQLSDDALRAIKYIAGGLSDQLDDLTWESGEFDHLDDEEQMKAAEPRENAISLEFLKWHLGYEYWVSQGRPMNTPWDKMRAALDDISNEGV